MALGSPRSLLCPALTRVNRIKPRTHDPGPSPYFPILGDPENSLLTPSPILACLPKDGTREGSRKKDICHLVAILGSCRTLTRPFSMPTVSMTMT